MKQIVTQGIVLSRTDFHEADRIITVLTPDCGKVGLLAKGVRRPKSKLAGGIELLCISDFTYLTGRGELSTLVSSRLITHYGNVVTDIQRTMTAYDFIKIINRITETPAGEEFYTLLKQCFEGLNMLKMAHALVELWFYMHLLKITGQGLRLATDTFGANFIENGNYIFNLDDMTFSPNSRGIYSSRLIKLLRLVYAMDNPSSLINLKAIEQLSFEGIHFIKPIAYSAFGL